MIPRGIRNNNPGNLKRGTIKWLGLADQQTDPDFWQFEAAKWGIRAMARILKTYQQQGVTTIEEAITRWSPPSDNNDTQSYITAVCSACAVAPEQVIDLRSLLPKLIPAIIEHENGEQPYDQSDIEYAIGLA